MKNNNYKKVSFYTLGCKLNFAETSTITRLFSDKGYERVDFEEPADVVVINTCSVTQLADKKCRQIIGKASRISKDAVVAVVGCYSQLKPDQIAQIPGVDLVLGNHDKFHIMDYLDEIYNQKVNQTIIHSCEITEKRDFAPSYSLYDRTRSFLKVQDGCDYHCSYCTIPQARGVSRNSGIDQIVKEAKVICENGVREIVLTGVNIGDFGHSTGESLLDLLLALDKVEGIDRFRISSIEPNLLTNEIIEMVAGSKRFVPHFHIPLQNGSDEVLKLMSRRYQRDIFRGRVEKIKEIMPEACIGADVIVGFPGETEDLFRDSYSFIESLDISYLHVFPYSERRNTRAILFSGKVAPPVKEERCKALLGLSQKKQTVFYTKYLGSIQMVLMESQQIKGNMTGFSSNYIKVEVPYNAQWINQIIPVKLTSLLPSGNMTGILNPEFNN